MKKILALMAIAGLATTAQATVITYDFETDQSASFTTAEDGGPDSAVDFQYDYSTHVQDVAHIDVPIPAAPNAAATTVGVRIDANIAAGAVNTVSIFPDVSSAAAEFADGNWTMTFDVWCNHNGDANGALGSTEFWGFGAGADSSVSGMLGGDSAGFDGYSYGLTGDGGSSSDYLYFQGTGTQTREDIIGGWWGDGAANVNNSSPDWVAFFPNDGTLGTAPAGTVNAGSTAKQWITVELISSNQGYTRTVSFKRSADVAFTEIATTLGVGASVAPYVGYGDIFPSLGNPAADQFVVFDNIVLDGQGVVIPAASESWNLYK